MQKMIIIYLCSRAVGVMLWRDFSPPCSISLFLESTHKNYCWYLPLPTMRQTAGNRIAPHKCRDPKSRKNTHCSTVKTTSVTVILLDDK